MDEDLPRRRDDVLNALTRQSLDPLSGHELEQRIAILQSEIARTQTHMTEASKTKNIAEALFRKSQ